MESPYSKGSNLSHLNNCLSGFASNSLTYPSRNHKIVDANQVFLEFMQLLEILHLDHRTVKLYHHFSDLCEGS